MIELQVASKSVFPSVVSERSVSVSPCIVVYVSYCILVKEPK